MRKITDLMNYRKEMFSFHVRYALNHIFDPWAKSIDFHEDNAPSRCYSSILIIDDRMNEELRLSILNALVMIRFKLPVRLFTTEEALKDAANMFSRLSAWITIRTIHIPCHANINQKVYNLLLK